MIEKPLNETCIQIDEAVPGYRFGQMAKRSFITLEEAITKFGEEVIDELFADPDYEWTIYNEETGGIQTIITLLID